MKHLEETKERETIYEGQIFTVYSDQVYIHDLNQMATRELVAHSGGVCVAAKTKEDKYLLVKQYRYGVSEPCIEFIAGKLEINENPQEAIKRELEEEGGFKANTWTYFGKVYPSPAYLGEVIHLFSAQDLEIAKQHFDETEVIELIQLSLDEIIEKIESNEIKDMKTICLAYRLQSNQRKSSV